ncbi:hypothetical protein F511_25414 [Dorcoceras hygrometricum]|uniref:Uncharacterized protein n=1 Tax=Dorcoceras hygrometricum TaxID=472368 RepID=A0A2Z7A9E4_9LAMI|nr:hypothetical protein F511_25414 [Dorcoceras hygrometricum]
MTSVVMSSQSAVDKERKSWISDDEVSSDVSNQQRATVQPAVGIQLVVGSQHLRLRNHIFGLTHRIMVKRLATSPHDPLDQRPLVNRVVAKIQLVVGSQHLRLRNHIFGLTHRIMVKRLATSPHDPLGITESACKNHSVMVSVQYGPFNTNILIRSTTIGKSRVARDPITMHTSWISNSDIARVTRSFTKSQQKLTRHKLASWAPTLTEGPLVETEKEKATEKETTVKGKQVEKVNDSEDTEPLSKVLELTEPTLSGEDQIWSWYTNQGSQLVQGQPYAD